MARRKTALLMTVGTGIGEDKINKAKKLAHGLFSSIKYHNPDEVYLFGSAESKLTVDCLKKHYKNRFNDEFDFYEFYELNGIDNFNEYFEAFKNKILQLNDYKVIVDYTSGTKTMTMSAAIASMLYRKDLVVMSGDRGKTGIVDEGTEKPTPQNLYPVYDEIMFGKIKELFNTNRFESASILLDDIVGGNPDKEIYTKLFNIYNCFDIFDYETAFKLFDNDFLDKIREKWPENAQQFSNNRRCLNSMQKLDPEVMDLGKKPWKNKKYKNRCYYLLASLLNNAKRRFKEHKYDDAIARLYRSFEFIAQIELKTKYGLVTSNIDMEYLRSQNLDENYLNKLESTRDDRSGKIKLGLVQDYILLDNLGNQLGKFYNKNETEIEKSTTHRNQSILAHGFNFSSGTDYENFEEIVLDMANLLNENMQKFIEEGKFPNLT